MNVNAKTLTKILLSYGLLGPLFGGIPMFSVFWSSGMLFFLGDSTKNSYLRVGDIEIFALASYAMGLLPALATGTYLGIKAINHRILYLKNYYVIAGLFSFILSPLYWLTLVAWITIQTPPAYTVIVFGTPIVGIFSAWLMLYFVRRYLANTSFALQTHSCKSSPATTEA